MKSTTFLCVGVTEPLNKPLVGEAHAAKPYLAKVRSPKSWAFPVEDIVT
jgi:hypothetical protein